ncbi:MAG TPA: hypothetical protein VMS79_00050, partial [Methanomassiliicoccales archaeon]|nr:hypothetical protein [Methanomassiliicoccales archaeon]
MIGKDDYIALLVGLSAVIAGVLLNWLIELSGICLLLFELYRWTRFAVGEVRIAVLCFAVGLAAGASVLALTVPSAWAGWGFPWETADYTIFYWQTLIPALYAGTITVVLTGVFIAVERISTRTWLSIALLIAVGLSLFLLLQVLKLGYEGTKAFFTSLSLMASPVIIWSAAAELTYGRWKRLSPERREEILIAAGVLTFLAELFILLTTS